MTGSNIKVSPVANRRPKICTAVNGCHSAPPVKKSGRSPPTVANTVTRTDRNRFHDRIELDDHDQRDQSERNLHDQSHLGTVLTQLFILAVKTEIVSRRQLNCRKTWPRTFQHSGAQLTKWRIGLHGNRA